MLDSSPPSAPHLVSVLLLHLLFTSYLPVCLGTIYVSSGSCSSPLPLAWRSPSAAESGNQQGADMWTAGWRAPWGFSQASPTLSHLISISFPLLCLCSPCSSPSLSFCPIKSLFCVLLLLRSQALQLIISRAFPPCHPSSPFHPAKSSANLPSLFFFHAPLLSVAYIPHPVFGLSHSQVPGGAQQRPSFPER